VRKLMLLGAVFILTGSLFYADAPMIGTWKINFAKSRIPAGSKAANFKDGITVFREIENDLIEGVSTETQKDGKIIVIKSTFPKSGGFQTYQQGGPAQGISILCVVIDQYTMYLVHLANGKQVFLRRVTVSQDFKTITLEAKGNDAQGTPVDVLLLYEKQ
jgi:hypothetical protein